MAWKKICPRAVNVILSSYTLHQAYNICNFVPEKEDRTSTTEKFIQVSVTPNLRENHTFKLLVNDIRNHLHSGGIIYKYNPRESVGFFIGTYPRNYRSASLVLNIEIEIVLSQFNVQYDELFETVHPTAINTPTLYQCKSLYVFKWDKMYHVQPT